MGDYHQEIESASRSFSKTIERLDTYIWTLKASGNHYQRQKIRLSNQDLPVFFEEIREWIVNEVARGVVCDAFVRAMDRELGPFHGRSLEERFVDFRLEVMRGGKDGALHGDAGSDRPAHGGLPGAEVGHPTPAPSVEGVGSR